MQIGKEERKILTTLVAGMIHASQLNLIKIWCPTGGSIVETETDREDKFFDAYKLQDFSISEAEQLVSKVLGIDEDED